MATVKQAKRLYYTVELKTNNFEPMIRRGYEGVCE